MEQPISPEKQKALDKAQELRNKAGEEAKLRGECFEKSKKEFESGDKGKAKELSDEGKEHGAKMEEFNRQAAEAFFNAHNMGNDLYTIDLHGLYVEEAVERVKERFEKIGRKGTLVVIWGAGNHSEGGVRKIKPAILEILNSEKLVFDDDVPNHGGRQKRRRFREHRRQQQVQQGYCMSGRQRYLQADGKKNWK